MSGKVDLDHWGPHLRAAHRALALRAFERIDFVDFADQPRPWLERRR